MPKKYALHMSAFVLVTLVFAGITIFNVHASSQIGADSDLADRIVWSVWPASLFVGMLIVIAGVVEAIIRRRMVPIATWMVVGAASLPALLVFDNYAIECDASREIRRQVPSRLSVREQETVSPMGKACPTSFSFKQDSDGEWKVLSINDGHLQIGTQ